jgi:hypothetical protein
VEAVHHDFAAIAYILSSPLFMQGNVLGSKRKYEHAPLRRRWRRCTIHIAQCALLSAHSNVVVCHWI